MGIKLGRRSYQTRGTEVNAKARGMNSSGAFRTLRLARDFVEIGSWFWLMGGGFWKMARLGNGMPYENTS